MRRKITVAIVVSLVLAAVFSLNPVAWCFEKQTATRMPVDPRAAPFSPQEKEPTFCAIVNDDGALYWGVVPEDSGLAFAVYMDPGTCPGEPVYPFRITDIHFDLVPWTLEHNAWPVNLRFSIKKVPQGEKCLGPDPAVAMWSESFAFPEDSSYVHLPGPINYSLNQPFCVYEPFFLEIMYLDQYSPPDTIPTLSIDFESTPEDSCNNWGMIGGAYYRWSDFWSPPPPGDPIIRATGYTDAPECADLWYWKPDKPAADPPAPSGMPDFDQNQAPWVAYCGPVAVANCLWWFGAVPPGWGPPQLVDTLAKYFRTNPNWGTHIDTMQMGLEQYLTDYGFALQESTFEMPNFFQMEDSLKKCQDIILLLGFWYWDDQFGWSREGGHFVTMAGVCSESLKIAVSDPNRDARETGWPGRVRPAHQPHPDDPILHNNPQYVSHDMYQSTLVNEPNPSPGNPFWEINYEWPVGKFSGMNVPEKFKAFSRPAPTDGKQIYVTEVEFAVMICPTPSAVEDGEEDAAAPRGFELHQNYPNPFNNETVIKFNLQRPAEVSLTIYNILGQKVRTLLETRLGAGLQSVMWDGKDEKGSDVSSGIYFYQLRVGDLKETKRLVLLK
ncbi:MAG: T9SS type A sorting domain-containing protein [candidate division Zixibacteria bacterium]|nr:T9SS type A sorting domain-containing protein [candidate division Zixibacteria bacterium]